MQGKLWSWTNVTIFTVAVTHNGKTTTFAICSNYQQKDKYANGTFLERLYDDYLEDDSEVVEIVWSDGPTSEFKVWLKNKIWCFMLV